MVNNIPKVAQMSLPELKARCTRCKKLFVVTKKQADEARDLGVVFSECCNTLATVEVVTVKTTRHTA